MTVAAPPGTSASPRVAPAAGTSARVRLVFEGRQRGLCALARLLRERPAPRLEVELVALAVPRVPGTVPVYLGGAAATDWVMAAARGALDELAALLAREGIACRTRIELGTPFRALRAAVREGGVDLVFVATGGPRWWIAWLARRRGDRAPASSARMIVA